MNLPSDTLSFKGKSHRRGAEYAENIKRKFFTGKQEFQEIRKKEPKEV
jgi:hypothetical protein